MTTTDPSETAPPETAPPETAPGASVPFSLNPRHFGIDPSEPWPDDVPKGQDDSHWRYEHDPKGARRAERRIAFFWSWALLAGIGLALVYVYGGQPQVEGALLALAFVGLGTGMVLWARDLLPGHEVIASRGHHDVSADADRRAVAESLSRGIEPMARRPFLLKMLGLVGGVFGLAAVFPIASLGSRVGNTLLVTKWKAGTRVVTEDSRPLKPSDLLVNGIITAFPEGHLNDALSPIVLINLGNAPFKVPPHRRGWEQSGVVAFSKICTHAGCPVSLYNVLAHQLVCPCHQSTFDVLTDCNPVFGPASRPLPQLPLGVDQRGYLIATAPFDQPVGPGFWNRG
ncbi:MAG: Rieske 2Fe-2S domain-containing protein [Acidimicrobiales bacterium]